MNFFMQPGFNKITTSSLKVKHIDDKRALFGNVHGFDNGPMITAHMGVTLGVMGNLFPKRIPVCLLTGYILILLST